MPLDVRERAICTLRSKPLDLAPCAALRREAHKPLARAVAGSEYLTVAAVLAKKCNRHRVRAAQHHGKDALFLCVEVGKSVEKDVLSIDVAGLCKILRELAHAVAQVLSAILKLCGIDTVQKREVVQLIALCSADFGGAVEKQLG